MSQGGNREYGISLLGYHENFKTEQKPPGSEDNKLQRAEIDRKTFRNIRYLLRPRSRAANNRGGE